MTNGEQKKRRLPFLGKLIPFQGNLWILALKSSFWGGKFCLFVLFWFKNCSCEVRKNTLKSCGPRIENVRRNVTFYLRMASLRQRILFNFHSFCKGKYNSSSEEKVQGCAGKNYNCSFHVHVKYQQLFQKEDKVPCSVCCKESIIPTITLSGASKKEQYQLTRGPPPS